MNELPADEERVAEEDNSISDIGIRIVLTKPPL